MSSDISFELGILSVYVFILAGFLVGGWMFFFTPRLWSIKALQVWAESALWWLEKIVGTRMEVRGREHIPAGACIVAGNRERRTDDLKTGPPSDLHVSSQFQSEFFRPE